MLYASEEAFHSHADFIRARKYWQVRLNGARAFTVASVYDPDDFASSEHRRLCSFWFRLVLWEVIGTYGKQFPGNAAVYTFRSSHEILVTQLVENIRVLANEESCFTSISK